MEMGIRTATRQTASSTTTGITLSARGLLTDQVNQHYLMYNL